MKAKIGHLVVVLYDGPPLYLDFSSSYFISISEKLRQLQCTKIKDLPFRIKYKSIETQI